jgi:hypothetical protein
LYLLVFCARFLKQSTVTYLFLICYETFFKKELLAFVFRRSPLFAAFARKPGGKKKGEGEKHSPDSQEPTFNLLVAAKGQSPRPRCVNLRHLRIINFVFFLNFPR